MSERPATGVTAAIYARKSTEQIGIASEMKSVGRQVANARAFALSKGWRVPDEFVFVDDGISGAEFKRRPGLQAMLRFLDRPLFQVVIVAEQKSLGRESSETGYLIKRFAQAGVEIIEYTSGRSLTPKTWIDKVTSAVLSSVDEGHREQTRQRTHEAHLQRIRQGMCVGGRIFGYRNVDVFAGVDEHGRPLRSHVERQIESAEAAVVVRIFELFASGLGLKAIAKRLTNEQAIHPKPFRRSDGLAPIMGWSPTTIRAVLCRDLYRGVLVWNRSRKRDDWGQKHQHPRPESDWQRVPVPQLRIVSDELWSRVASRLADTKGKTALNAASGRVPGRPPKHGIANLLAGLATCWQSSGALIVETSARKDGRVAEYICASRRKNGSCENRLRIPIEEMNEAVLQAIEEHALTPPAIESVIRLTERDDLAESRAALDRERKD